MYSFDTRTLAFVLQGGQSDNRLLLGDPKRTFHGLWRVQVHNQQQRRRGYHVDGSRVRTRSVSLWNFQFFRSPSRRFRLRRYKRRNFKREKNTKPSARKSRVSMSEYITSFFSLYVDLCMIVNPARIQLNILFLDGCFCFSLDFNLRPRIEVFILWD